MQHAILMRSGCYERLGGVGLARHGGLVGSFYFIFDLFIGGVSDGNDKPIYGMDG